MGFALVMGRPASLYLVALLLIVSILRPRGYKDHPPEYWNHALSFFERLGVAVSDVAVAMAIGVALVVAIQSIFVIAGSVVHASAVRAFEERLAVAREVLGSVTGLKSLGLCLGLAYFGMRLFPGAKLVSNVLRWRDRLSLVLNLLVAMTSFTFMSAHAIEGRESEWIAQSAKRMSAQFQRADTEERRMLVEAAIQRHIEAMPVPERQRLATAEYLSEDSGARIGRSMTGQDIRDERSVSDSQPRTTMTDTGTREPPNPRDSAAILKMAFALEKDAEHKADQVTQNEEAALAALVTFASSALNIRPEWLKPFIDSMIEAAARSSALTTIRRFAPDIAAARRWLDVNVSPFSDSDWSPNVWDKPRPTYERPGVTTVPIDTNSNQDEAARRHYEPRPMGIP
jgi:hypothetical protein